MELYWYVQNGPWRPTRRLIFFYVLEDTSQCHYLKFISIWSAMKKLTANTHESESESVTTSWFPGAFTMLFFQHEGMIAKQRCNTDRIQQWLELYCKDSFRVLINKLPIVNMQKKPKNEDRKYRFSRIVRKGRKRVKTMKGFNLRNFRRGCFKIKTFRGMENMLIQLPEKRLYEHKTSLYHCGLLPDMLQKPNS